MNWKAPEAVFSFTEYDKACTMANLYYDRISCERIEKVWIGVGLTLSMAAYMGDYNSAITEVQWCTNVLSWGQRNMVLNPPQRARSAR